MDKSLAQQTIGSSTSYSMQSLADSSAPPLSEAQEIHEVAKLVEHGERYFKMGRLKEALQCYNDALEIDEQSVDCYIGRAAVHIQSNNFTAAQKDTQKLLTIDGSNAQGHYLHGVALHNLGFYRESLNAFLHALELDSQSEHINMLTDSIAAISAKFCEIPESLMRNFPEMDGYKKLSEVGACLYASKKYDSCIMVLNAAQKLETNQKGITMKVQLTLGNAHTAIKEEEQAIANYQECLRTAISAHDAHYQTKALVSIASLYMEKQDTHQAVIYYEKLLDLQRELQGEDPDTALPSYWNNNLRCALHLNLSIAFKAIGNMHSAVEHALEYVRLVGDNKTKTNAEATSHRNVGILYEILGEFDEALKHYKLFQELSKKVGDKKGLAQAYGCLGGIYGHLHNVQMAIALHEQHITMATGSDVVLAHEQYGDTLQLLGEYDKAVDAFTNMFKLCEKNDVRRQTTALCKLGNTYKIQKRYQYSIYYYDQAKGLAEDFEFPDLQTLSEFNLACIMQHSTQVGELEQSRKYFLVLIPVLEAKIQKHREEDTFCAAQLMEQLKECYNGLQNVLGKLNSKEECLQYAEAYRKKEATSLYTSHPSGHNNIFTASYVAMYDVWTIERMKKVVTQHNATVLYYSALPDALLLWVLQPGEGLVRFYAGKSPLPKKAVQELLKNTVKEFQGGINYKDLQYGCEQRALPRKGNKLDIIRKKYRATSEAAMREKYAKELCVEETKEDATKEQEWKEKGSDKRLFNMLIGPVYDILEKLDEQARLVIIPDGELRECPFGLLKDWSGIKMMDRFSISIVPSMYILEKCLNNETIQQKERGDVENERAMSRLGGLPSVLSSIDLKTAQSMADGDGHSHFVTVDDRRSITPTINPRQVSNPRFITSGGKSLSRGDSMMPSRDVTYLSAKSEKNPLAASSSFVSVHHTATAQQRFLANKLEKASGVGTISTITTNTSTKTDITHADCAVTQFKQICDQGRAVVFGCPQLPKKVMLYGSEWEPSGKLMACQNELYKVSDYLETTAIIREHATKERLIEAMKTARILHIATLASLQEGVIALSPSTHREDPGPPLQSTYAMTAEDIAHTTTSAQLVVLSTGWAPYDREHSDAFLQLPSAFLSAGAQCVLTLLWPVANKVLDKFYCHFYKELSKESSVCRAVANAVKEIENDDRYSDVCNWGPFIIIGKDVNLSVMTIRSNQLHQTLDKVQDTFRKEHSVDPLNPACSPTPKKTAEIMNEMQKYVSLILSDKSQEEVIKQLTSMLDNSLKRLHTKSPAAKKTETLPLCIEKCEGAMGLLKTLGFHFQPRGGALSESPSVVYPHWNPRDMLLPVYEALKALSEISSNSAVRISVIEMLPTSMDNLAFFVDVLCITKHAADVQLKVSDVSVRPLWRNKSIRAALSSLGFHQIGLLLNFTSIPSNRRMLNAVLQLFISLCPNKSTVLLHKLDVGLLGAPHHKGSTIGVDQYKLPSLTPLLLPRNQMRLSTPWLTSIETSDEMTEKVQLARSATDLYRDYRKQMSRAKTWHQNILETEADESLSKIGRPRSTPQKVKVKGGSSASQGRVPIDKEPEIGMRETEERRDYANYVLSQRLQNVTIKHKTDTQKLYLPYVTTTS